MQRILVIISIFVITLVQSGFCLDRADFEDLFSRQTKEEISRLLEQRRENQDLSVGVARLLTHEALETFYAAREFRLLWQDGPRLHPAARILVEHLRGAAEHGLCSDAYLVNELEGFLRFYDGFSLHNLSLAPVNRALFDLFLTQAFLAYATHQVEGQVDPALTHVDWRVRRRKANLTKLLVYALQNNRFQRVLAGLMPQHEGYRSLVSALADYRELSARGGWPSIPAGPAIRPGDVEERLPLLRERLTVTGDLDGQTLELGSIFSQTDHAAVKRFQTRHGLVVDGVVGQRTLAVLNVPVEQRIRQMELNLERWRWLPKSLGKRHIQVNIAAFNLNVVEEEQPVISMPVVVGTAYRKTPVFSARMTYLELAPTWTVPPTILREDKLPAIKANPDYLINKHFRILKRQDDNWVEVDAALIDWAGVHAENFPGIMRQDPGPWNPLGRIKFMFPNSFNVYMHDTNEPQLFKKARRSYSSGCIRVERPVELAQYLLEGIEDWDGERLLASLENLEPIRVNILPLPVHIQYWTAWADADGTAHFRKDIYYRDLDLEVALSEPDYQVEEHL
ncbi:MAG: L,D-transpeptidase family protein [Desulfuromonadales bacterium]|nr:L,D-transpeptidase family protein [Desulfuromonadales bacterium]